MKRNLKKEEEFLEFFHDLQKQKYLFYTKKQLHILETYKILLFDCFLWNYRDLYMSLFKDFLNFDISADNFTKNLINLRFNHIKEFDQSIKQLHVMSQLEMDFEFLNTINFNKNEFGFADIIDLVEQDCDSFVSNELLLEFGDIRKSGEIDENQLRQNIKKTFLLIS